jgi:hypothetical protein
MLLIYSNSFFPSCHLFRTFPENISIYHFELHFSHLHFSILTLGKLIFFSDFKFLLIPANAAHSVIIHCLYAWVAKALSRDTSHFYLENSTSWGSAVFLSFQKLI